MQSASPDLGHFISQVRIEQEPWSFTIRMKLFNISQELRTTFLKSSLSKRHSKKHILRDKRIPSVSRFGKHFIGDLLEGMTPFLIDNLGMVMLCSEIMSNIVEADQMNLNPILALKVTLTFFVIELASHRQTTKYGPLPVLITHIFCSNTSAHF